jgi:peptidoglycan/LPS O-acetylase OafA/YrhL
MSSTLNQRIPSLDGLRTVSIALVIASHAARNFGPTAAYNIGDLGVRVFFVISGFLITGLLIAESEKSGRIDLLKFYFRRTLRIFPPYYFLLIVLAVLAVSGRVHIAFTQFLPVFSYASDYIYPGTWDVDHAWSLAVEEQFYLLFPGLMVLLRTRRKMIWALGAILILCPLFRFVDHSFFADAQPIWLTKGFHANADTLGAGCLLAFLRSGMHANKLYAKAIRSPIMLALPLAVFFVNSRIDYTGLDLGFLFSVNNILMALLVDWAVTNADGVAGKVLNSRVAVFLGMMSYSIYLWQQPFLEPDPPSRYFAFPYSIIGFAAAVCVSYFLIERYSLRLRKRLEARLFPARTQALIPTLAET